MFVHIYRRGLASPYGLDSTYRVALMFVFCKLGHHGKQFDFALFCFYLMHTMAMDLRKLFCGPLGVHGPTVGDHWCRQTETA